MIKYRDVTVLRLKNFGVVKENFWSVKILKFYIKFLQKKIFALFEVQRCNFLNVLEKYDPISIYLNFIKFWISYYMPNLLKDILFILSTSYQWIVRDLLSLRNIKKSELVVLRNGKGTISVMRSGVDCEYIYGAIFFVWTLDSILYGLLIVSCLFPSANKGISSKGMIEFVYRFVINVVDLPALRFLSVCFVRRTHRSDW